MLIFFLSFLFFNCTEEWIRTDIDGRVCVAGGGCICFEPMGFRRVVCFRGRSLTQRPM